MHAPYSKPHPVSFRGLVPLAALLCQGVWGCTSALTPPPEVAPPRVDVATPEAAGERSLEDTVLDFYIDVGGKFESVCGASVVELEGEHFLMTAAHCFVPDFLPPSHVEVRKHEAKDVLLRLENTLGQIPLSTTSPLGSVRRDHILLPLKGPPPGYEPLTLSEAVPEEGVPVRIFNRMHVENGCPKEIYGRVDRSLTGTLYIASDVQCQWPGVSGSPVENLNDHTIVGLVSVSAGERMLGLVPATMIRATAQKALPLVPVREFRSRWLEYLHAREACARHEPGGCVDFILESMRMDVASENFAQYAADLKVLCKKGDIHACTAEGFIQSGVHPRFARFEDKRASQRRLSEACNKGASRSCELQSALSAPETWVDFSDRGLQEACLEERDLLACAVWAATYGPSRSRKACAANVPGTCHLWTRSQDVRSVLRQEALLERACEGGEGSACLTLGYLAFSQAKAPDDAVAASERFQLACDLDPVYCTAYTELFAGYLPKRAQGALDHFRQDACARGAQGACAPGKLPVPQMSEVGASTPWCAAGYETECDHIFRDPARPRRLPDAQLWSLHFSSQGVADFESWLKRPPAVKRGRVSAPVLPTEAERDAALAAWVLRCLNGDTKACVAGAKKTAFIARGMGNVWVSSPRVAISLASVACTRGDKEACVLHRSLKIRAQGGVSHRTHASALCEGGDARSCWVASGLEENEMFQKRLLARGCEAGHVASCLAVLGGETPATRRHLVRGCKAPDTPLCQALALSTPEVFPKRALSRACNKGAPLMCLAEASATPKEKRVAALTRSCRKDGAACAALGRELEVSAPKKASAARARGCRLGDQNACVDVLHFDRTTEDTRRVGLAWGPDLTRRCALGEPLTCMSKDRLRRRVLRGIPRGKR